MRARESANERQIERVGERVRKREGEKKERQRESVCVFVRKLHECELCMCAYSPMCVCV